MKKNHLWILPQLRNKFSFAKLMNTKVVLIDKVVLGGPKKGNEKEQYFWVQNFMGTNLWVQKMSKSIEMID